MGGPPPPLHARGAARALLGSRARGQGAARLGISRLDLLPPPTLRAATLGSGPGTAPVVPAACGGRARRGAATRPPVRRRRARSARLPPGLRTPGLAGEQLDRAVDPVAVR